MACSDLLSLRSDSLSLASEPTISRTVSGRQIRLTKVLHQVVFDEILRNPLFFMNIVKLTLNGGFNDQESTVYLSGSHVYGSQEES